MEQTDKFQRNLGIVLGIIAVFIVGAVTFFNEESVPAAALAPAAAVAKPSVSAVSMLPSAAAFPKASPAHNPAPTNAAVSGYTLAQVAAHNGASSCWSAINGGVYDLTAWINQHPGGPQAILAICGKDGSAAFNNQHGGQRRPANELAGFKIGDLIK